MVKINFHGLVEDWLGCGLGLTVGWLIIILGVVVNTADLTVAWIITAVDAGVGR